MQDAARQVDSLTASDLELAAEFSGAFCELGDAIGLIAQNEAEAKRKERSGGKRKSSAQKVDDIHKYWYVTMD